MSAPEAIAEMVLDQLHINSADDLRLLSKIISVWEPAQTAFQHWARTRASGNAPEDWFVDKLHQRGYSR
jgi:hypothetical protein